MGSSSEIKFEKEKQETKLARHTNSTPQALTLVCDSLTVDMTLVCDSMIVDLTLVCDSLIIDLTLVCGSLTVVHLLDFVHLLNFLKLKVSEASSASFFRYENT